MRQGQKYKNLVGEKDSPGLGKDIKNCGLLKHQGHIPLSTQRGGMVTVDMTLYI